MKRMGGMFYFSTRPKGKDFLGATTDLTNGWRMRYMMIRAAHFPAGMGWQWLRGSDRRPTVGFAVQDVRKLEDVDSKYMTEVTSAMLEEEGLWRREEERVMQGEGSASWDAGEGSNFVYNV